MLQNQNQKFGICMENTNEHRHASVYDILYERLGGHSGWKSFVTALGKKNYKNLFSLRIFNRAAKDNIGMGMRTLGDGTKVRTYPRKWLVSEITKVMEKLI